MEWGQGWWGRVLVSLSHALPGTLTVGVEAGPSLASGPWCPLPSWGLSHVGTVGIAGDRVPKELRGGATPREGVLVLCSPVQPLPAPRLSLSRDGTGLDVPEVGEGAPRSGSHEARW